MQTRAQRQCQSVELIEIYELFNDKYIRFDITRDFQDVDTVFLQIPEHLHTCEYYLRIKLKYAQLIERGYLAENALPIYLELLIDTNDKGFDELRVEVLLALSKTYSGLDRKEAALNYLLLAETLVFDKKLSHLEPTLLEGKARYRAAILDLKTCRLKALDCIKLSRKLGNRASEASCLQLLTFREADLDKAIAYGRAARDIHIERKNYYGAAEASLEVCHRLANSNKYEEVLKEVELARQYLELMPYKYKDYYYGRMREAQYNSMSYEYAKDFKSALNWHRSFAKYYGLSLKAENQEKIDFINVENNLKIKEKKLEQVTEDYNKNQQITIAIGSLLLLTSLLGFLLYRGRKIIKKNNDALFDKNAQLNALLNKHEILLSEIHHRVKNNLQNITSLIFFQMQQTEDIEYQEGLKNLSSKIYSIALIHDHLYQHDDFENINFKEYIKALFHHFQSVYYSNPMFLSVESEVDHFNLDTMIPLGLITAELIINSAKYATVKDQTLEIQVSLTTNDTNKLRYSYRDNGPGLSSSLEDTKSKGMGMIVLKSMTRQLKGKYQINSDNGYEYVMQFIRKTSAKI